VNLLNLRCSAPTESVPSCIQGGRFIVMLLTAAQKAQAEQGRWVTAVSGSGLQDDFYLPVGTVHLILARWNGI